MLQGCSEQIVLEGQDWPRTYLARHELEYIIILSLLFILSWQCLAVWTDACELYVQNDACQNTLPSSRKIHATE